jgi:hypothetical protein
MKEWIMELCPELAEWQVDLIVEHAGKVACPSCGSNKVECSVCADVFTSPQPQPKQEKNMTTIDKIMLLADQYAHIYSFVGDNTMPIARQALRAAIEDALTPGVPTYSIKQVDRAYELGFSEGKKETPQPQQWVGLTDMEKYNLVTDWFAEDWAIEKAMGLLDDYDAKLREKNS